MSTSDPGHRLTSTQRMADDELAAALLAGVVGADWSEQAAVDLLVGQRGWLGRWEFRQGVEAAICDNGELCAWVRLGPGGHGRPGLVRRAADLGDRPLAGRGEGRPAVWPTCLWDWMRVQYRSGAAGGVGGLPGAETPGLVAGVSVVRGVWW